MNGWLGITRSQKKIDDFHLGPIDLTIEHGTVITLVSNNGSGKSVRLKMIMNLVKPDWGNIKAFDKFIYGKDESWKNKIAYCHKQLSVTPLIQEAHWIPWWPRSTLTGTTYDLLKSFGYSIFHWKNSCSFAYSFFHNKHANWFNWIKLFASLRTRDIFAYEHQGLLYVGRCYRMLFYRITLVPSPISYKYCPGNNPIT